MGDHQLRPSRFRAANGSRNFFFEIELVFACNYADSRFVRSLSKYHVRPMVCERSIKALCRAVHMNRRRAVLGKFSRITDNATQRTYIRILLRSLCIAGVASIPHCGFSHINGIGAYEHFPPPLEQLRHFVNLIIVSRLA